MEQLRSGGTNKNTPDQVNPADRYTHFNSLFNISYQPDPGQEDKINNFIENLEDSSVFNELCFTITHIEVKEAITNLKTGKVSGMDEIPNEMLKSGVEALYKPLSVIFNKLFINNVYPQQWREGMISAATPKIQIIIGE